MIKYAYGAIPCEAINKQGGWHFLRKEVEPMSIFEAISIVFMSMTFVIILISLIVLIIEIIFNTKR